MIYSLVRTKDGAGDSGPYCLISRFTPAGGKELADKPKVGFKVRVGSPYARTYVSQDWWETTPITKIVSENTFPNLNDPNETVHEVTFYTRSGSLYIWRHYN